MCVGFYFGRQDNKYKFIGFPNYNFACEKDGDKQLVARVKIAIGVGSFRYICPS
jgi:hypothetical protein